MLTCSCCDRREFYRPAPCGYGARYCAWCVLCERHCGCGDKAQFVEIEEADEDADQPAVVSAKN